MHHRTSENTAVQRVVLHVVAVRLRVCFTKVCKEFYNTRLWHSVGNINTFNSAVFNFKDLQFLYIYLHLLIWQTLLYKVKYKWGAIQLQKINRKQLRLSASFSVAVVRFPSACNANFNRISRKLAKEVNERFHPTPIMWILAVNLSRWTQATANSPVRCNKTITRRLKELQTSNTM